jgi:hypothetical protein
MAWYDGIIDFVGKYGEDIVNVGTSVYDIYNQQQLKGDVQEAMQPGGITDPFGAERPAYQARLAALYQDPSYLQNLPGYQFQQQQGEEAINRQAAKSGHFLDQNRLYEISKFNTGLAETSYNQEATRLANLAGANIAPNAQVFDQMLGGVGDINAATGVSGGKTATSIFDLLKTFSSGSGGTSTGGAGSSGGMAADALKWVDTEFDLGLSDMLGGYEGNLTSAISRIAAGEDPEEVLKDEAMNVGKDYLTDQAKELWAEYTADQIPTAADTLGSGGSDAGIDSLYGDAPGPSGPGAEIAEGVGEFAGASDALVTEALVSAGLEATQGAISMAKAGGTLAEIQGVVSGTGGVGPGSMGAELGTVGTATNVSKATSWGSAGGAAGGLIASYLATKYVDDNPAVGIGSGLVGSLAGGAAMGAIAGATGAAAGGVAAGAAAGAASAAVVAGPLALAAAVYMIGSGIYGMVKGSHARDKSRDEYRRVAGYIIGQSQVADPTGMDLGSGYNYESGGHEFFLPAKHYTSLYQKNMYGSYPSFGSTADVQGSFGYYHNPDTDEWVGGQWAQAGLESFNPLAFQFFDEGEDIGTYQGKYDAGKAQRAYERELIPQKGPEGETFMQARGTVPIAGKTVIRGPEGETHIYQPSGGGDTRDRSCFVAGCLVRMADGTLKKIEDIEIGEEVKSLKGPARVDGVERVALQGRNLFGFLHIGDHAWFTDEHPFLSKRGYVAVKPNAPGTVGWGAHRVDRHAMNEVMRLTDVLIMEKEFFTVDGVVERTAKEQTLYNLMLGDGLEIYYVGPREDTIFAVKH